MFRMTRDGEVTDTRESMLLRGSLDLTVLALLRAPNHAYGVVQALQAAGFTQTGYGTVYPLVTRLRRQGLLTQVSRPGAGGPAKNVLSLTPAGRTALNDWEQQWHDHVGRVRAVLNGAMPDAAAEQAERNSHV